jgi:predicted RNA-binding protein
MKNYYCLGTSDSTNENAIDILKRRIDEKKYPLYKKTPFLNDIKKNDEVVFYVAGRKNKSQNFIAYSVIQSVEIPNETLVDPDKNKYVLEKYLLFENITLLKTPIHIKAIINQLEFIKNKTNFGVYLMGGVSRITENDFNLIKK